jgi:hypothetical protein
MNQNLALINHFQLRFLGLIIKSLAPYPFLMWLASKFFVQQLNLLIYSFTYLRYNEEKGERP